MRGSKGLDRLEHSLYMPAPRIHSAATAMQPVHASPSHTQCCGCNAACTCQPLAYTVLRLQCSLYMPASFMRCAAAVFHSGELILSHGATAQCHGVSGVPARAAVAQKGGLPARQPGLWLCRRGGCQPGLRLCRRGGCQPGLWLRQTDAARQGCSYAGQGLPAKAAVARKEGVSVRAAVAQSGCRPCLKGGACCAIEAAVHTEPQHTICTLPCGPTQTGACAGARVCVLLLCRVQVWAVAALRGLEARWAAAASSFEVEERGSEGGSAGTVASTPGSSDGAEHAVDGSGSNGQARGAAPNFDLVERDCGGPTAGQRGDQTVVAAWGLRCADVLHTRATDGGGGNVQQVCVHELMCAWLLCTDLGQRQTENTKKLSAPCMCKRCKCACLHTYTRGQSYTLMQAYVCTCTRTHLHTDMHRHAHRHAQTCTRAQTHILHTRVPCARTALRSGKRDRANHTLTSLPKLRLYQRRMLLSHLPPPFPCLPTVVNPPLTQLTEAGLYQKWPGPSMRCAAHHH